MNRLYYKWLREDGCSPYRRYQWPLPENGEPGEWVRAEGELGPCKNGIHACTAEQVAYHISPTLWEMEGEHPCIDDSCKVCMRAARLIRRLDGINEQTLRLFTADCAEWVLPMFEEWRPSDHRPREAIQAARRFALGLSDVDAVEYAAHAAIRASRDAAHAAYMAAGNPTAVIGPADPYANSRYAASNAAYTAFNACADVVAENAAHAADVVTEYAAYAADRIGCGGDRPWQSARLLDYAYRRIDLEAIRATCKTDDEE